MKFRQMEAEVEAVRTARAEKVVRCMLEKFVVMIAKEPRLLIPDINERGYMRFKEVDAPVGFA